MAKKAEYTPSLTKSMCRVSIKQTKCQTTAYARHTGKEIKGKNPLALILPTGNLNVHLVDIILDEEFFLSGGSRNCRIVGFPASEYIDALLFHLAPPSLQPFLRLLLDDRCFDNRKDVARASAQCTSGEYGELEKEHDHHGRLGLLNHRIDRVLKQPQVIHYADHQ